MVRPKKNQYERIGFRVFVFRGGELGYSAKGKCVLAGQPCKDDRSEDVQQLG
jgi:hypothetical protein